MQDITLQTLPPAGQTWTIEEFLDKNEESCRLAAIELNRKSQMVSEAVEEVLNLVQNATQTFKSMISTDSDILAPGDESVSYSSTYSKLIPFISHAEESKANTAQSRDNGNDGSSVAGGGAQQQDWSILWSCFENPLSLLSAQNGLPKGMKEMVCNAVSEMRRYYSRKVIDVLIKVTRASLDLLRKQFVVDGEDVNGVTVTSDDVRPIFLVHSMLMIPNVAIRPTLDELQDALIAAGKNITGVAKGVAQWTSGKDVSVFFSPFVFS